LSLCLTKYHTLKPNPVLNQAPRHEDMWGSGGPKIKTTLQIWRKLEGSIWGVGLETGFIWLRIGTMLGCCECGNEPSDSVKAAELLD
jgi:hypothetical protein